MDLEHDRNPMGEGGRKAVVFRSPCANTLVRRSWCGIVGYAVSGSAEKAFSRGSLAAFAGRELARIVPGSTLQLLTADPRRATLIARASAPERLVELYTDTFSRCYRLHTLSEQKLILRGIVRHEALHLRHTCWSPEQVQTIRRLRVYLYDTLGDVMLLQRLLNVVEDVRIEHVDREDDPSGYRSISVCEKVRRLPIPVESEGNTRQTILGLRAFGRPASDYQSLAVRLRPQVSEFVAAQEDVLASVVGGETSDVLVAAYVLYRRMQEARLFDDLTRRDLPVAIAAQVERPLRAGGALIKAVATDAEVKVALAEVEPL